MTLFENIKSKNIDEFVDWLNECVENWDTPWDEWWSQNYCSQCEPEIVDDTDLGEGRTLSCAWCELHDKCKYFKELDDIPDSKQVIKMWLESEFVKE